MLNADTTDVLTSSLNDLTDKNLFSYCDNNPIIRTDSNGMFWEAIAFGAAVGGLVSGVTQVISNVKNGNDWRSGLGKALISGMVSGAMAAIPGGPIRTMLVGAVGNVLSDAVSGNINSWKSFAVSATTGALANGVGYVAGKGMVKLKTNKIMKMPRTPRKNYLRDVLYKNGQEFVDKNLDRFTKKGIKHVEKYLWLYKSSVYSTLTSTSLTLID